MTENRRKSLNPSRDKGLDVLKYLCTLLVICIHTGFVWQQSLAPILHIAVPVFFIISGYYYRNTAKERRGKQIRKIFRILVLSELLYILWNIVSAAMGEQGMEAALYAGKGILGFYCSGTAWKNLLLFNMTRTTHLWYLAAFLYVLILLALFERFADRRRLYPLIPLLLGIKLLLGDYSCFLFGFGIPIYFTRNFLLLGLPLFLLGDLFREKADTLGKLTTGKLIRALLLLLPFAVMENVLLRRCAGYEDKALCISTILYAGGIVLLFSRRLSLWETPLVSRVALWGGSYTLTIYVMHILIMQSLAPLGEIPFFKTGYAYVAPLVVLAASTLAAALLQMLSGKGKRSLTERKTAAVSRE